MTNARRTRSILALLLAAAMLFVLAACSEESESQGLPFDFSLGEHIGVKTYDEMLDLLNIKPEEANLVRAELWTDETVTYNGKAFEQIIAISDRAVKGWQNTPDNERENYVSGVGYYYTFPEDTPEDEIRTFLEKLYNDMIDIYGEENDPVYENVVGDALAKGELPNSGRTYWIDSENSDFRIGIWPIYAGKSYRIAVYRTLSPELMANGW